jgi:hypothetical protein
VADGSLLIVQSADLDQSVLAVVITQPHDQAKWFSVGITALEGATLESLTGQGPQFEIVLNLIDSTGSFTFEGVLEDWDGTRCVVSRTFTFDTSGATPVVADSGERTLPFESLHGAAIEVCSVEGPRVELRVRADRAAPTSVRWSVTAGETARTANGHMVWTLPDEPGLYQARLEVEFGRSGLAMDSVVFEVA